MLCSVATLHFKQWAKGVQRSNIQNVAAAWVGQEPLMLLHTCKAGKLAFSTTVKIPGKAIISTGAAMGFGIARCCACILSTAAVRQVAAPVCLCWLKLSVVINARVDHKPRPGARITQPPLALFPLRSRATARDARML